MRINQAPLNSRTNSSPGTSMIALLAMVGFGFAAPGSADLFVEPASNFCSATSDLAYDACLHEVADDHLNLLGRCINEVTDLTRTECIAAAEAAKPLDETRCQAQKDARNQVCLAIGEDRFDPAIDPALFSTNFKRKTPLNLYFPLTVGHIWNFGGSERVRIEVLDRTKLINGIRCVVVRDTVTEDGLLVEDTYDWFAQALNGDAHYCGEEVKDYEYTEGDQPARAELVSNDGSFKAGRDEDKAGIAFKGTPVVGQTYRQEFSLGNAEDIAKIVSINYSFGEIPELDRSVPANLALRLCNHNCIVVQESQPREPGKFERKYYARGLGQFLGVNLDAGTGAQLTNCNFSPRCKNLPKPAP